MAKKIRAYHRLTARIFGCFLPRTSTVCCWSAPYKGCTLYFSPAHDHYTILDKAGGSPYRTSSPRFWSVPQYSVFVCALQGPIRHFQSLHTIPDKVGGRPCRTLSLSFLYLLTIATRNAGGTHELIFSSIFSAMGEVCIKWGLRVREYAAECYSGPWMVREGPATLRRRI